MRCAHSILMTLQLRVLGHHRHDPPTAEDLSSEDESLDCGLEDLELGGARWGREREE